MLKRAAQLITLAIALLLIGVAFKVFKDRRARAHALTSAYAHFIKGIPPEIDASIQVLERSIADVGGEDPETLAARALARGHQWAEFGIGEAEATTALQAVPDGTPGQALVRGMIALGNGDLEAARAGLDEDPGLDGEAEPGPFVVSERVWMKGVLTLAQSPDDAEAIAAATTELKARLEESPQQVAVRRQLVLALVLGGDGEGALAELAIAREHAPSHMGLSADDALYNASLHQKLSGVASVAEQLLAQKRRGLSTSDRAHAQLARAVVHVQSGEHEEGLKMLDAAWDGLPAWDLLSRRLAIRSALEAGDSTRIEQWVDDSALPEAEGNIYRAWAVLVEGDVMGALRRLAKLPQADPWVGYLQALALVEQGRFDEAGAWIEHTEKNLRPMRLEIEVARARMELRLGDKKVALRKLKALAEEEARAPRAWTGLGEAYLLQDEPDLTEAKKAFQRAIERESHPAEAMLRLAEVWDLRRTETFEAIPKARALLERAAKTNPHLPRYREELALYLADIGYPDEARELMEATLDDPGIGWTLVLRLTELQADDRDDYDPEPLLTRATELGAPPVEVSLVRAAIDIDSGDKDRIAKAQADLAALIGTAPTNVQARVLYSKTFLKQFDRKAAETAVRRGIAALEDESKDGRLLFAWAQIEARTAKTRRAAPRARRAWLHLLAENRPPHELLDVADLATRLWLKIKRERPALTIAEQLTDRLGYHSMAWTIRARTELTAGEADKARASAKKAIEIDDQNPRAHEIHGHALLRYGLKDKARAAYEKAVELVKGTPLEGQYRANFKRF